MVDKQLGHEKLISLTSDIVAAHVSNNTVSGADIPPLISGIFGALAGLGQSVPPEARPDPAVSVRASVKQDYLVCLEDGKRFKMLKRHLLIDHGMTTAEYRVRWGLGPDYPMIAPDYAQRRREIAKAIGLGRKSKKMRGRRPKAQA